MLRARSSTQKPSHVTTARRSAAAPPRARTAAREVAPPRVYAFVRARRRRRRRRLARPPARATSAFRRRLVGGAASAGALRVRSRPRARPRHRRAPPPPSSRPRRAPPSTSVAGAAPALDASTGASPLVSSLGPRASPFPRRLSARRWSARPRARRRAAYDLLGGGLRVDVRLLVERLRVSGGGGHLRVAFTECERDARAQEVSRTRWVRWKWVWGAVTGGGRAERSTERAGQALLPARARTGSDFSGSTNSRSVLRNLPPGAPQPRPTTRNLGRRPPQRCPTHPLAARRVVVDDARTLPRRSPLRSTAALRHRRRRRWRKSRARSAAGQRRRTRAAASRRRPRS